MFAVEKHLMGEIIGELGWNNSRSAHEDMGECVTRDGQISDHCDLDQSLNRSTDHGLHSITLHPS